MKPETGTRGPRPMTAFVVSLAVSSVLMGVLLLSDRRVLELRRARTEVQTLDRQIAQRRRENESLRQAIGADPSRDEPLPRNHPFWRHPRIALTPHVSAVTLVDDSIAQVVAKIGRLERGESVSGIVDRARGY